MIVLAQLAKVHLLKVKAQKAFFLDKSCLNQRQQFSVRSLAVKRLMKLPVECADLAEIYFGFKRLDKTVGRFKILVGQQWH